MKSPDLNYILNRLRQQSTSPDSFAAAVRLVAAARATAEADTILPRPTAEKDDSGERKNQY